MSFSRDSSVQFSSVAQLCPTLWNPRIATRQTSLSITNSQSLLKLMSIESVMPSNHLILCCALLLPPSIFPSIRVFFKKSALCIRGPKYWRDSQESSTTPQFKSINSLALSFLYSPTLTSIHDHWKNHSLDYTDLC